MPVAFDRSRPPAAFKFDPGGLSTQSDRALLMSSDPSRLASLAGHTESRRKPESRVRDLQISPGSKTSDPRETSEPLRLVAAGEPAVRGEESI